MMNARQLLAVLTLAAGAAHARYVPDLTNVPPLTEARQTANSKILLTKSAYYVDGTVYAVAESGDLGGIVFGDVSTVTLWFKGGSSLEATGLKSAAYTAAAQPGIAVPPGKTLILRYIGPDGKTASLTATGGGGVDAEDGTNGDSGGVFVGGAGGRGGHGGSAGAAGIGGAGGTGGAATNGGDGACAAGSGGSGSNASAGTAGGACGTIWIFDGIKVTAAAGRSGEAGSGGDTVHQSEICGPGAGGGGGGAGGATPGIGGGGGGGGGAGGGGSDDGAGGGGGGGAPYGRGGKRGDGGRHQKEKIAGDGGDGGDSVGGKVRGRLRPVKREKRDGCWIKAGFSAA